MEQSPKKPIFLYIAIALAALFMLASTGFAVYTWLGGDYSFLKILNPATGEFTANGLDFAKTTNVDLESVATIFEEAIGPSFSVQSFTCTDYFDQEMYIDLFIPDGATVEQEILCEYWVAYEGGRLGVIQNLGQAFFNGIDEEYIVLENGLVRTPPITSPEGNMCVFGYGMLAQESLCVPSVMYPDLSSPCVMGGPANFAPTGAVLLIFEDCADSTDVIEIFDKIITGSTGGFVE